MTRADHAPRRIALALVALAFLLYGRTLGYGFLSYDDPDYVTENPAVVDGLSLVGLRWAFVAFHSSNWHPLTWLSHQLDCQLFGLAGGAHHGTNVLLHALNAVLCFRFFLGTTNRLWPSAFVAAAFCLHPLRVESVAWVSERKDLLSGSFFFLTLLAWARYVRAPSRGRYLLALAACAGGLLAKPGVIALPLVLVLVDLWPLGRPLEDGLRSLARLVLEKLPFLVLGLASACVTVLAQRAGGALGSLAEIPLGERVANAFHAHLAYVGHTLLPLSLSYFYPHHAIVDAQSSPLRPSVVAGVLLVSGATLWAVRSVARGERAFGVGWLWFVVVLFPMVGIVQVGDQSWANRYAYLSTIGLVAAVAFPAQRLAGARWIAGALLLLWAVLAWREVEHWRDSRSLHLRALAVTERNYVAEAGYANVLRAEGDVDGAREHYRRALEVYPDFPEALYSFGLLEQEAGDLQRAAELYLRAAELQPEHVGTHLNLGAVRGMQGRLEEAVEAFAVVLSLSPGQPAALHNLEGLRALARRPDADPRLRALLPRLDALLAP